MKVPRPSHLSIAAALALTSSAFAQVPPPVEGRADTAAQRMAERQAAAALDKKRATGIIGKNVDAPNGDNIGEVKDLVLDDNGKATHAIVSYGGAAGIGAKQVAIPWKTVMSMARNDRIVMDPARLRSAPALPEDRPDLTSRDWSREADRYWERVREAAVDSVDRENRSEPR